MSCKIKNKLNIFVKLLPVILKELKFYSKQLHWAPKTEILGKEPINTGVDII